VSEQDRKVSSESIQAPLSESEQVVRDFFAARNGHDTEKMFALYSEDFKFEDVPFGAVANGKDQYRRMWSQFFGALSDVKFELNSVVASGELVATEWTFSATQTGDFHGVPATGRSFSVRGMSIFGIRQGKVRKKTDYWDSASMLRQLGAMPKR